MSQPSVLSSWAPDLNTQAGQSLQTTVDGLPRSPAAYSHQTLLDSADKINHEYRQRIDASKAGQWYFDEFSGLYRHKAPPSTFQTTTDQRPNQRLAASVSKTSLDGSKEGVQNRALLDRSQTTSIIPAMPRETSSLFSSSASSSTRPTLESVEQVYAFRAKARASGDTRVQLEMCHDLMQAAWQLSTAGPQTLRKDYQPDSIRRRKKKELDLSEVMVIEARRMLKRLATIGQGIGKSADSEAQFMLANCFGVGALGFPIDHERAFQWYLQASKQAHSEATYRTAVCYELGIGTRKDVNRAVLFYRKASNLSHGPSMYKMGIILLRGYCNQAIHAREAVSWLQRASATSTAAHPHALHALAMIQLTGECVDTSLIADQTYALELLNEAANLDHAESQVKLGEIYEKGALIEADDSLSIYWYSRAAQQGNSEAELALSGWYLTGSAGILTQSDREAYLWARKAAASSKAERWTVSKALYLIAFYTEHGVGIEKPDLDEAKKLYLKSAVLGHRGACNRYNELVEPSLLSLDDQEEPPKEEQVKRSHKLLAKQFQKCIIM